MRATIKTLSGFGLVTAALLFSAPVRGQTMSGGTGSFSGGGSSSGGGGGGSSSGGGSSGSSTTNGNFSISGEQLQTGVGTTPSTLNSFNNVGSGSATNGIVSTSNPLAAYYYNPLSQGLITFSSSGTATPSNVAFGNPLYGNLASGSTSSAGGRGSSAFGSSSSGTSTFGGSSSSGNRGGTSLNGTATIRSSTTGTSILYTGATSFGPAIGRRGPVIGGTAHLSGMRPIALASRQAELQQMVSRSSRITAPGGITVTTDGNTVVLSGSVTTPEEKEIAANVLRTSPGVVNVRNDLKVTQPGNP